MARLYANENFPLPVVEELRRLGHDVLTTQDTGKAGQAIPDEEVLEFATSQGRGVLTLNRKHFIHLGRLRTDHGGIVRARSTATSRARLCASIRRLHAVCRLPAACCG